MQGGEVPCPRSWLKDLPESGQVGDSYLIFQGESLGYPSLPASTRQKPPVASQAVPAFLEPWVATSGPGCRIPFTHPTPAPPSGPSPSLVTAGPGPISTIFTNSSDAWGWG